jgi:hypothetical protein
MLNKSNKTSDKSNMRYMNSGSIMVLGYAKQNGLQRRPFKISSNIYDP